MKPGGTRLPLRRRGERRALAWALAFGGTGRRVLLTIGLYRVAAAVLLLGIGALVDQRTARLATPDAFNTLAALYLLYGVVALWRIWRPSRRSRIANLPTLLLGGDLFFVAALMLAGGGDNIPLPILIFPQLAASGWLLETRIAFFHAAIAALVLLGLDAWAVLQGWPGSVQPYQTGLFGLGYFATIGILVAVGGYARASEALAEQRGIDLANLDEVNRLIIHDMQDGVLVVDNDGVVARFNVQAARLLHAFGVLHEGMPLAELSPAIEASWRRRWEDGRQPGSPLVVDPAAPPLRVRFVLIGSEKRGGTMIYLEDTGRAQKEARQIKLAAMGRLTASIAHEVRNPLSAISHAAQLLEEDTAIAADSQRLLAMILNNAKRIDRIVGEVLQLSRRDRQQAEAVEIEPFLNSLLDEIARTEKIPAGCIVVKAAAGLEARFDRGQLSQILWNLVRNAWQHCRRMAGSIYVEARPGYAGDKMLLELSDDGPGIPEQLQNQVFEPFFTTRNGGSGLGLYVARELADANGATLDLLPRKPGAHFRLLMPTGNRPKAPPEYP